MNIIKNINKSLSLLFICCISFLVYYNSLTVPFYLDDFRSIANNAVIHTGSVSEVFNTFGMRVFAYLSFWFDYQLIGSTSPVEEILTQLHLSNIIIHMLNGFLVFSLAYVLTYKTPNTISNASRSSNNSPNDLANNHLVIFPLACALLFIVHPLHSQAVTYIVQRTAALVTLFYLASLFSYLWLRLTPSLWQKALALTLTFAFAGFAFFTKQNSFTLPIAIMLIECIFFNRLKIKHLIIVLITTVTGVICAYLVDNAAVSLFASKLDSLTRETDIYSRLEYFLAQLNILWIYIAKFIIPYPLRLEYSYQINTFPFWQTVIAGVAHIVLIGFALIQRKKLPLIAFGILFYYIAHTVESSIIPIKDLVFEHRVYLPDFGLIMIVLGILTFAKQTWQPSSKFIFVCIISLIILCFSFVTAYRNTQWQEPISFYQNELAMNPTSCRVLHNLADQYHIQGKIQPALAFVEQCLAIKQGKLTQPEMINNYVAMLIADKQFAKADKIAIDALRYVQEQISRREILENLGISKLTQKQNSLAEHYLTMATKLPNPYPKTYFALSVSLAKQKKYIDAKKYVEMGLQLEPSNQRGKIILQRLNKLLNNHK